MRGQSHLFILWPNFFFSLFDSNTLCLFVSIASLLCTLYLFYNTLLYEGWWAEIWQKSYSFTKLSPLYHKGKNTYLNQVGTTFLNNTKSQLKLVQTSLVYGYYFLILVTFCHRDKNTIVYCVPHNYRRQEFDIELFFQVLFFNFWRFFIFNSRVGKPQKRLRILIHILL